MQFSVLNRCGCLLLATSLGILALAGCGGEGSIYLHETDFGSDVGPRDDDSAASPDVGVRDSARDHEDGAPSPDAGPDATVEPLPRDLAPCDNGDCWETSLGGAPCSVDGIDENFSSGNYNVHRYASLAWDAAPTRIQLVKGAGSWEPALVITDGDGAMLFDGVRAAERPGLTTAVTQATDILLTAEVPTRIHVFVTSSEVIDGGFVPRILTDATYTLNLTSDCGGPRVTCTVNGNNVRDPACGWLHYVARRVVPRLAGTRAQRIDGAGVVAWWALKEGVMFLDNPIVYSNCNFPDGDARIGPLESCVPDRPWQVGLSGVQVPYHTDAKVEGVATARYPDLTTAEVLRLTATEARLDAASIEAVVSSTGTLRRSWLLRNSAVGFEIEEPVVRGECVNDSRSWCYGTGWDTTRLYAPNRTAALAAIEDVKSILDEVAP